LIDKNQGALAAKRGEECCVHGGVVDGALTRAADDDEDGVSVEFPVARAQHSDSQMNDPPSARVPILEDVDRPAPRLLVEFGEGAIAQYERPRLACRNVWRRPACTGQNYGAG